MWHFKYLGKAVTDIENSTPKWQETQPRLQRRECLHGVCRQNGDLWNLTDATIEFRDPENIETDILHDHLGRQDIAATSYTYV